MPKKSRGDWWTLEEALYEILPTEHLCKVSDARDGSFRDVTIRMPFLEELHRRIEEGEWEIRAPDADGVLQLIPASQWAPAPVKEALSRSVTVDLSGGDFHLSGRYWHGARVRRKPHAGGRPRSCYS